METNKKYKVVKSSKKKEFLVGDIVSLNEDGSIGNHTACGWINKEDVESATKGWQIIEIE
jgi:hypothetical protein